MAEYTDNFSRITRREFQKRSAAAAATVSIKPTGLFSGIMADFTDQSNCSAIVTSLYSVSLQSHAMQEWFFSYLSMGQDLFGDNVFENQFDHHAQLIKQGDTSQVLAWCKHNICEFFLDNAKHEFAGYSLIQELQRPGSKLGELLKKRDAVRYYNTEERCLTYKDDGSAQSALNEYINEIVSQELIHECRQKYNIDENNPYKHVYDNRVKGVLSWYTHGSYDELIRGHHMYRDDPAKKRTALAKFSEIMRPKLEKLGMQSEAISNALSNIQNQLLESFDLINKEYAEQTSKMRSKAISPYEKLQRRYDLLCSLGLQDLPELKAQIRALAQTHSGRVI